MRSRFRISGLGGLILFAVCVSLLAFVGLCFLLCGCQAQGIGGPDEVMEYKMDRYILYVDQDSLHKLPEDSIDWDTMVVSRDTVDSMLDRTFRMVEEMNVDMMFCLYEIVVARAGCVEDSIALIDSILDDWEARGLITKEASDE